MGIWNGKRSARTSLTDADVRAIRASAASGALNARELGELYGVGAETVRRILRRETWMHLGETPAQDTGLLARLLAVQEEVDRPVERMVADVARSGDAMLREIEEDCKTGLTDGADTV